MTKHCVFNYWSHNFAWYIGEWKRSIIIDITSRTLLKTGTTIPIAQSERMEDEDIEALKIHDKLKDIEQVIFLNNTFG